MTYTEKTHAAFAGQPIDTADARVLAWLIRRHGLEMTHISRGSHIGAIFSLGVSPFVMASTEAFVGFVLNGTLSAFGDIYVSALSIMQRAMQIVSVPLAGISAGYIPIVSYNYGNKNPARVKEAFKIALGIKQSLQSALRH